MIFFAELYDKLEQSSGAEQDVSALAEYFDKADRSEIMPVISLLLQRRPKRMISSDLLKELAIIKSELPLWLFEESCNVVDEIADVAALLTPSKTSLSKRQLSDWIRAIQDVESSNEEAVKDFIFDAWDSLSTDAKYLFNKLVTGTFRMSKSRSILAKALSLNTDIDELILMQRLMIFQSDPAYTIKLLFEIDEENEAGKHMSPGPYPFQLTNDLLGGPGESMSAENWIAGFAIDGLRVQLVKRNREIHIWTNDNNLVTDKFPELVKLNQMIPDNTVIDGEIVVIKNGDYGGLELLKARMGRKKVTGKISKDFPTALLSYDLLEYNGKDMRNLTLHKRIVCLNDLVEQTDDDFLNLAETLPFESWDELNVERTRSAGRPCGGFILRHMEGAYSNKAPMNAWLLWKPGIFTVNAILLYVSSGGSRANPLPEYTMGLRDEKGIVPVARLPLDLMETEQQELDQFIKENTIDRFGPVRNVKPELVFKLAFEGIVPSRRHKSGVILRAPQVLKWQRNVAIDQSNFLEDVHRMLP